MSETFEVMALRVACEEGITSRSGDEETECQRIVAFATRIRDELCKGQEPATAVVGKVGDSGGSNMLTNLLPMGTKLYLHPSPIPALPQDDTALKQYGAKLLREWVAKIMANGCTSAVTNMSRMADELEGK